MLYLSEAEQLLKKVQQTGDQEIEHELLLMLTDSYGSCQKGLDDLDKFMSDKKYRSQVKAFEAALLASEQTHATYMKLTNQIEQIDQNNHNVFFPTVEQGIHLQSGSLVGFDHEVCLETELTITVTLVDLLIFEKGLYGFTGEHYGLVKKRSTKIQGYTHTLVNNVFFSDDIQTLNAKLDELVKTYSY